MKTSQYASHINWKTTQLPSAISQAGADVVKTITSFRVLRGNLVNHEFKTRTQYCEIPLLIKLSLHCKQDDSEQERPLSKQYAINLKNIRPTFFQDYPNVIGFNLVHLCPSMLLFLFAVFGVCCSTDLRGDWNVSFYFLGILGVMKLHQDFIVSLSSSAYLRIGRRGFSEQNCKSILNMTPYQIIHGFHSFLHRR